MYTVYINELIFTSYMYNFLFLFFIKAEKESKMPEVLKTKVIVNLIILNFIKIWLILMYQISLGFVLILFKYIFSLHI